MMEGFVPSGLVKRCSRTVNPARLVWNWRLCELPGARESNIKSVANRTRQIRGYILVIDDHAELCKLVSS
jgi:hypothetical protein